MTRMQFSRKRVMYFGKSSLFSFESRACHQTGVFESLQVNSQLSSCLADIRDYGVSTSTPGRNDEEIKAVLGKLPFLPCCFILTNLRGKLKWNSETRNSVNLASSPLSFEIVAVFPNSRGCHPR